MSGKISVLNQQKSLRKVHRETHQAISELSAQEAALRAQIRELEKFIIQSPSRARREEERMIEMAHTIPAPDEWRDDADEDTNDWAGNGSYIQYVSELEPPRRLMRRQAAELKRQRRQHFFTFVIVAALVGTFAVWLWKTLH